MSEDYELDICDGNGYVVTLTGKQVINSVIHYKCHDKRTGSRYLWIAQVAVDTYPEDVADWEVLYGTEWKSKHGATLENLIPMPGEINADKYPSVAIYEARTNQAGTSLARRAVPLTPEKVVTKRRKISPTSSPNASQGIDEETDLEDAFEELNLDQRVQEYNEDQAIWEASQALTNEPTSALPSLQDDEDDESNKDDGDVEMEDASFSTCDKLGKQLSDAYNVSLLDLVEASSKLPNMLSDSWDNLNKGTLDPRVTETIRSFAVFMLAAMDGDVLKHLIAGDIPEAVHTDAKFRESMKTLRNISRDKTPSIYIHYLVKRNGQSPTPTQISRLLDKMELYLDTKSQESCEFAGEVDTQMSRPDHIQREKWRNAARKGQRRYLNGENPSATAQRIAVTRRFIQLLRRRLRNSVDLNKPLPRPLSDVGFATSPLEQLGQQEKHDSSNYLMNLAEAICMVEFPEYRIRGYILFHCFKPIHAHIGEILFSRLAQCYISNGGGFSHHPASISIHHARDPERRLYRETYAKVKSDPGYVRRVAKEMEYLRSSQEEIDKYIEQKEKIEELRVKAEAGEHAVEKAGADLRKAKLEGRLSALQMGAAVRDLARIAMNDPDAGMDEEEAGVELDDEKRRERVAMREFSRVVKESIASQKGNLATAIDGDENDNN
jgi:hypothetical protein